LPRWMRNLSFEWIYRFYLEPQRLWKRYLYTNSYFLLLTFIYMITLFANKIISFFAKAKQTDTALSEPEK